MNNDIPHSGNLAPGDIRMIFSNFFRQVLYGFSDNFQSSKYSILFLYIVIKFIFGNTIKKFLDMLNALKNILKIDIWLSFAHSTGSSSLRISSFKAGFMA